MATGTSPARRMRAGDRRAQLLDATEVIVAEQGFHAVSIEAVGRQAGVSRPIVYDHFGDLTGLLEALIDRLATRALEQLAAVLPTRESGGDPADVLLRALRGYLDAALSDSLTWRLVLMPPEGAPPMARERVARGRALVVAQLAEAVGQGIGGGGWSPDPELTARLLSTVADDAVRLVLSDPAEYPPERVMAHARWLLEQLKL